MTTSVTISVADDHVIVSPAVPVEDQVLLDFLAAQRETVLDIVAGLDEEAWHRSVVPSGWTPAGLVEHLSGVELHWFQEIARHAGHLDIARELLDGKTRLGQNAAPVCSLRRQPRPEIDGRQCR